MRSSTRQEGAALLVSLVMLVILTLFVITAINMTSVNLKIVGNEQSRAAMEANAQQAIEQVISSGAAFNLAPAAQTVTVNGMVVSVRAPVCIKAVDAQGYSAVSGAAPEDTNWELLATVTDPMTGATATHKQGIRIRMPSGNCPS